MALPIDLWLIHPQLEMCDAFRSRFDGLPNVTVLQSRFEDLPPHDCFVTAANAFGIMNAGIDAAVIRFHGSDLMTRVQHRILDQFLGEQPIGTSFIEPTGNAQYPFIAHSPTMRVPGSIAGTDKVYCATWASLIAVYRYIVKFPDSIRSVVFPAMGAGFGGVPYTEVARQMAAAYRHYLSPPHRMNWDMVAARQKSIHYDGNRQVSR
ncbi:macro domain-containing protein [Lignipirellula cremea]|uniref:RNase III inhibitor n=1 Tax=Lignipirellula cremea TaxID=2528010 RepID=A0A518DXC0_9BACT|nr:macro domain-containing protein [Lignipirellula cremea]QDU96485.1 RNase III inhibitor [Lignipirellula cremea]